MVDVPPGQVATTTVTLTASRAPAGQQLTRPFTILASDGRSEVQAEGSLIQSSAERRPLARVLLTLFGGLSRLSALLGAALVVGTFVAFAITGRDVGPDTGAILVLAGCIAGYIGGLLARR
jgi:hypothetical protein